MKFATAVFAVVMAATTVSAAAEPYWRWNYCSLPGQACVSKRGENSSWEIASNKPVTAEEIADFKTAFQTAPDDEKLTAARTHAVIEALVAEDKATSS